VTTPAPKEPIDVQVPSDPSSPAQLRQFAQQVRRSMQQHTIDARITAGDEAANVRRITIQIVNRRREAMAGRFPVDVLIATTQSGTPSNSQTTAVVAGTLGDTYINNAWLKLLTDADGKIQLDVTIAGAATRWVTAAIPGWSIEAGPFDWT
jgi:hypothetical protein